MKNVWGGGEGREKKHLAYFQCSVSECLKWKRLVNSTPWIQATFWNCNQTKRCCHTLAETAFEVQSLSLHTKQKATWVCMTNVQTIIAFFSCLNSSNGCVHVTCTPNTISDICIHKHKKHFEPLNMGLSVSKDKIYERGWDLRKTNNETLISNDGYENLRIERQSGLGLGQFKTENDITVASDSSPFIE